MYTGFWLLPQSEPSLRKGQSDRMKQETTKVDVELESIFSLYFQAGQ